ncbi:Vesicle-associated membrane protein 711 [Hondaea fermentalgiana]|uniref:Vesicle-associated membrane protein 711 n=1 Tax=Hondaea fermentalgiana TaxID=2315210 RepID=A0A2R5GG02_9STRA|nr:Vesicle-associated membrane protein 711 [Hondaea fermentalgiana]|eukprot:GBG29259.1 Vesicle-associated membrane protein 711 [Hondaea fermentalgiana]
MTSTATNGKPSLPTAATNGGASRLVYAVVARGITPLVEHTSTSGNFPSVARVLLAKIQASEQTRMSYIYDDYAFHFVREANIAFLCLTDEQFSRKLAFAFLEDVKERFKATYPRDAVLEAGALAFNEGFSRVLRKQMDFYADPRRSEASYINHGWMSPGSQQATQGPAVANVEKLLRRGEKIELLVEKQPYNGNGKHSHEPRRGLSSMRFDARGSRRARPGGFLSHVRSVRGMLVLFIIIVVLVVSIVSSMCGGLDLPACQ